MTAPMKVVLASRNQGKAREFGRLLGNAFLVEALPQEVAFPPEDGKTFQENAKKKALAVYEALGGSVAVLADDSGLEVDALGRLPGVRSARFAGECASDEENIAKLLGEMKGRTERAARFVCALCLVMPGRGQGERLGAVVMEASGVCEGTITEHPRGTHGFGYDPVFVPRGWGLTFAELSAEDKDAVSHRGAAVRALLTRLSEGLATREH